MRSKELKHYGILGMKWGVRRYQNKDGTLTSAGRKRYDRDELSKKIRAEADREYKETDTYKHEQQWRKSHPNADPDDYGDYAIDDAKYHEIENRERSKIKRIEKKYSDAMVLRENYMKDQLIGNAVISSVMLAPVSMFAASKLPVRGKAKVATVLGAGLGAVAVTTLHGAYNANENVKQVAKKYGLD